MLLFAQGNTKIGEISHFLSGDVVVPEFGMAGALETLCGQSYGAEQYEKVGSLTCIPIACLWIVFMEKILIALGQTPSDAFIAYEYTMWLIPSLLGFAFLQPLIKYLQIQSIIFPMFICATITLALHISLCWMLMYKIDLGIKGAALSISMSVSILLSVYMRYSTSWERTCKDVYTSSKEFLRLGFPSSVMV